MRGATAHTDDKARHARDREAPNYAGEDVDLDAARAIDVDGRERAAECFQSWLDGNVRIAGDRLFFRRRDMLVARYCGGRDDPPEFLWEDEPFPRELHSIEIPADPRSYAALRAHLDGTGIAQRAKDGLDIEAWLRDVPPSGPATEPLARSMGSACFVVSEALSRCLARAAGMGAEGARAVEPLAGIATRVVDAEMWARIGLYGRDDPAGDVAFLQSAAHAIAEATDRLGPYMLWSPSLAALDGDLETMRAVYLPLCRPEAAPEDIESLATVAGI